MTVDREELRRLWRHVLINQHSELTALTTGIPAALDELDAKDRRITELEFELTYAATICEINSTALASVKHWRTLLGGTP
jgi:hypothetical protein